MQFFTRQIKRLTLAHILLTIRRQVGFRIFTFGTLAALNMGAAPSTSVSAEAEAPKKLTTTLSLSNEVGSGTFVENDYSDDPYFGQSLSISPKYQLVDKVSASASWSLGWELTMPGNSTGRRYTPSDVSLKLSHSSLYRDSRYSGVNLTGSVGAIVPTSYEARFNHTITNLTFTPGLSRAFIGDKLSLSYSFSFTKYLPSAEGKGFSPDPAEQAQSEDDFGNLIVPCREGSSCAVAGGLNNNYGVKNSFSISYAWTEKLSTSISAGISNTFKYEVNDSPYGDPVLYDDDVEPRSRGRSDTTSGSVDASYQVNDIFSVSVGAASSQSALEEDRDGLRFPWWDFKSPAKNYSQIYASVSAAL